MKKFNKYINKFVYKEYYVPYDLRDNFIQFLRILKENEKTNISILYKGENIIVSAIPKIHEMIKLSCLN